MARFGVQAQSRRGLRRWGGVGQRQGPQQPTRPLTTCLVVATEDSSRLPALWSHLVSLHPGKKGTAAGAQGGTPDVTGKVA